MELHIENADPKYSKAKLIEPTTRGYIYVAGAVHPGHIPPVLPNAERSAVLSRLKTLAQELEGTHKVIKVNLFRAIMRPPTARMSAYLKQHAGQVHIANFDVVLLIETVSPEATHDVQTMPACQVLINMLRNHATDVFIMAARNAKRIGDVDTRGKGLFLFNHFAADDRQQMLQLWDYLAGWYAKETHLDNSIALVPLNGEGADYAVVNWARWDQHPLQHFWNQLSKKSFWNYVRVNLDANHAASMPIYCRLA